MLQVRVKWKQIPGVGAYCRCVCVCVCVVKTDPLHIEGERLPASGLGLEPAQHHVGVAHLAGVDVRGREGNFDLT